MSCKYCDPNFGESVHDDLRDRMIGRFDIPCGVVGDLRVELLAEEDILRIFVGNINGGNRCIENRILINYCPMCGRKVNGKMLMAREQKG